MANIGFKVAQQGHSIEEDDKYMILSSEFPFLKAKLQGSFSKTVSGAGTVSQTIPHNLGYPPVYLFYGEVNPATPNNRFPGSFAAIAVGYIATNSYVDNTNLYISWTDTSTGIFAAFPYTVNFYYYLFYDHLI